MLPNELFATASHLKWITRQKINDVICRALRSDLQLLRRKGAIKVGGSLDRPIIDSKSACARCCLVFGYINRGAECNLCKNRVCRECRIDIPFSKNDWVCIICYKEMWVNLSWNGMTWTVLHGGGITLFRIHTKHMLLDLFLYLCLCVCPN